MVSDAELARRSGGPVTQVGEELSPWLFRLGAPPRLAETLLSEMAAGAAAAAAGRALVGDRDEADETVAELISAQRKQIRRAALNRAIPDGRAKDALRGLACLEPADQHPEVLRGWLADPETVTLVLAGGTGNGKTMAAYAVAAEAAIGSGAAMSDRAGRVSTRQLVVRAWSVNGYLAELRPEGSPDPVWQIRNSARSAELLILDDLGAEVDRAAAEFVRKELAELLGWRVDRRLRTVFTTNLRSVQVQERLGPRFWSRLAERSLAVTFLGPDRRDLRKLSW